MVLDSWLIDSNQEPSLTPAARAKGSSVPGRWVDAGDVRVGDELMLRDRGICPVEAVRLGWIDEDVYNVEVEDLHCFAVSGAGILVHNDNGPSKPYAASTADGGMQGVGDPRFSTRSVDARQGAAPKGGPKTPIHPKVAKTEAEATAMADAWKQGQATRPIIDRGSGQKIGEITADGNRVIRYPHTDKGTPQKHWNLEDKTTGENIHVVIE